MDNTKAAARGDIDARVNKARMGKLKKQVYTYKYKEVRVHLSVGVARHADLPI